MLVFFSPSGIKSLFKNFPEFKQHKPESLSKQLLQLVTSHLSQYLLELASEFNTYYAQHRVLGDDSALSADRLALVEALKNTLGRGLKLLCIEPLERM